MIENKEKNKINHLFYFIIIFSLIIFSLIAPWLLTQFSILDLTTTGEIGDTLGGIMNPFIALAGVIVTYLAFKMQYEANQNQIRQFNTQLNKEKEEFKEELALQRTQFSKTQFENQFYEMLRIHRENVNNLVCNEVYINTKAVHPIIETKEKTINGVKTFPFLLNEYILCIQLVKINVKNIKIDYLINEAYGLFWHGNSNQAKKNQKYSLAIKDAKSDSNNKILTGNSNQLAHYYRQLFQTVKFTVNQEKLTYEEKRNYLRILRSQLSNEEQVLLFYNWMSNFGKQWNDDKNSFFVDYRMIHNIFPSMLIAEINLEKVFNKKDFQKEKDREYDPLFKYQEY